MTSAASFALEAKGITKDYGAHRALDHVDFTLNEGEIHALLGENGAGKTTLMNILRGLTPATAGQIRLAGSPARIATPQDATAHGVGMVHQHFLLVPVFTVIENLLLASQKAGLLLDRAGVQARAQEVAQKLGWSIPFSARVADLATGTQQRVEILKALLTDARILLFDEPTAVLAPAEIEDLFSVLRALRADGRSLVFVSHKLAEVIALCDRVTVLRRGKVVYESPVADTDPNELARQMVGDLSPAGPPPRLHHLTLLTPEYSAVPTGEGLVNEQPIGLATPTSSKRRQSNGEEPVIAIKNLSTSRRHKDEVALKEITLSVAPGEILGIAGVDGNGQAELFEVLAGLRPFQAEEFTLAGQPFARLSPQALRERCVSVIPPDRHREGLALSLSVRDNLTLEAFRLPAYRSGIFLRRKRLRGLADQLARDFDIRAADLGLPVSSLSGGNQQKVVIARALWRQPALLVAASPTRGLDIAATAYVHQKLRECQREGGAIVLISTELEEILSLANRVAVLYAGCIAGIVAPTAPRQQIGLLMGGNRQEG